MRHSLGWSSRSVPAADSPGRQRLFRGFGGTAQATVGSRDAQPAATYQSFVEAGIVPIDAAFLEDARASRLCLGSEGFRARIRALYEDLLGRRHRTEDIAFRRTGTRLPTEQILQVVCAGLGVDRVSLLRRRRDSLARPWRRACSAIMVA